MTLRDAGLLLATIAVPFAACYGLGYLSRWLADRRDPIDALIKAPRTCHDMHTVDWQKTERTGERRWQETLRAQRRMRKREQPATPAEVRRFPRVVGRREG